MRRISVIFQIYYKSIYQTYIAVNPCERTILIAAIIPENLFDETDALKSKFTSRY